MGNIISSNRKNDNNNSGADPGYFVEYYPDYLSIHDQIELLSGSGLWTLPQLLKPWERAAGETGAAVVTTPSSTTTKTIPPFTLSDGPHGVRKPLSDLSLQESYPSTCYPAGCAVACSWDTEILEMLGNALSKECQHYNIHVLLGPAINLKRHPACGRNMEYFSEDPFLIGTLASSYISGIQSYESYDGKVVGACIKHFAVNNQETYRMVVNAVVDVRTLRELYLPGFEMTIRNKNRSSIPTMIMGAYNKLNGTYCCENEYLLTKILREEWQYTGVTVTDWGATNSRPHGILTGMDIEMPGNNGVNHRSIYNELDKGSVITRRQGQDNDDDGGDEDDLLQEWVESSTRQKSPLEKAIGISCGRVLQLQSRLVHNNTNVTDIDDEEEGEDNGDLFQRHHEVAKEIALNCVVLLKNENNVLPLSSSMKEEEDVISSSSYDSNNHKTKKIALIGAFGKDSRYQGMGSSHVTPTRVDHVYDCLVKEVNDDDDDEYVDILYAPGYDPDPISDDDNIDQGLIDEAIQVVEQEHVSAVIVMLGLPEVMESEGFDRQHLQLPKQQIALLEAITTNVVKLSSSTTMTNKKLILILSHGGVIELPSSCIDQVPAILDGYLLGQAGGSAIVDILFGKTNPSGKLPETIPMSRNDIPSDKYFPGTRECVEYKEGLNVGYRHFNTTSNSNIPVRFPFGHGLSYTTFEYSELKVSVECDEPTNKKVVVEFTITNTGSMAGKEVAQCYVAPPRNSSVYRPYHELKGFDKKLIEPNSSTKFRFELDHRSFAFYDIGHDDWIVEAGECEIQIGSSSRDIRLS